MRMSYAVEVADAPGAALTACVRTDGRTFCRSTPAIVMK